VSSTADSVAVAWGHDAADRRDAATMGSNLSSTFGYDSLDRLETIVHQDTNGTPSTLFDVAYGYDPVGNRKFTRDNARTTLSELYVHDPRDRLRKMQRGTPATGNDYIDAANPDQVVTKPRRTLPLRSRQSPSPILARPYPARLRRRTR